LAFGVQAFAVEHHDPIVAVGTDEHVQHTRTA
jgi:hypothetical protein